jgi:hypothetical protein
MGLTLAGRNPGLSALALTQRHWGSAALLLMSGSRQLTAILRDMLPRIERSIATNPDDSSLLDLKSSILKMIAHLEGKPDPGKPK